MNKFFFNGYKILQIGLLWLIILHIAARFYHSKIILSYITDSVKHTKTMSANVTCQGQIHANCHNSML